MKEITKEKIDSMSIVELESHINKKVESPYRSDEHRSYLVKRLSELKELESIQEQERLARSEAREEESLSISRKALHISKRANKIAISAIVLSIITAIIVAIIQFMSDHPPS